MPWDGEDGRGSEFRGQKVKGSHAKYESTITHAVGFSSGQLNR